MVETLTPKKELEDLQEDLHEIQELLRRQRLVDNLTQRQDQPRQDLVESLVHKQSEAVLRAKLDRMHPDRKSTRLNSSHIPLSRMPSSA